MNISNKVYLSLGSNIGDRESNLAQATMALAVEYDKRVARMIFAAASNATEPLNKSSNSGRTGQGLTLGTDYTASGATRQAKGDALVNAIFDARVGFEGKDVSIEDMACTSTEGSDIVQCTGQIVANYGAEDTSFPLSSYRVVQEDGEWKWCGEAS